MSVALADRPQLHPDDPLLTAERVWSITRNSRRYWVHRSPKGKIKVLPAIAGAATASTPSSAAQAAQTVLNAYLASAATKFFAIQGTVPTGSAGGSTATVQWAQQIPIVPAFCTAIEYTVQLPVSLTLPATTGTATLSPFAPYSALAMQLTLGGAPPWPLTELTPWHIDETMHRINYDPNYPGLGNNEGYFANILDQGPTPNVIGGANSLNPGATVTNTTGAAVTTNYNFTFKVRINLQRKRHLMWGAIPFGDPENRPYNVSQLLPLIGNLPEQALFVNASNGATCVTNGAATVTAVYELSYIDLLPPGVSAPPQPAVGYGLQLVTASPGGINAGILYPTTHRTAMIYTAIHKILVNGELPIRADYFGLWDDQDSQSARWAFDAQVNSFQEYFDRYHRTYRRYPYTGVYSVEMDDGQFPEIPSVTPYVGLMSPDATYASAFGVPVTPAMTTVTRVPAGTAINNAYVRNYEFGLVRVPY